MVNSMLSNVQLLYLLLFFAAVVGVVAVLVALGIHPSNTVRNTGVVFDQTLSLDEHVISVCKSALFHLQNIVKVREYLTVDSTKALVHAFVTCRLDNCNSLLTGSPKYLITKLQRIQLKLRSVPCG